MSKRMDLLVGREGKNGQMYWTKIGVAWPTKDGAGWRIVADAWPAGGEALLKPAKEYDGRKDSTKAEDQKSRDDLLDDLPF